MLNILDLVPSKAIRDYLKSIDYKLDIAQAFSLVVKFSPVEKRIEYLKFILDNYDDKEYTYLSSWWREVTKTYYFIINEYLKKLDSNGKEKPYLGDTEINYEKIPDWHFREMNVVELPVPFKDGDVLYVPKCISDKLRWADMHDGEPFLIYNISNDGTKESISPKGGDNFCYLSSFASLSVESNESIFVIPMGQGSIYCEYYNRELEGKDLILKELKNASINNKFEEAISKYKISTPWA